MKTSPGELRVVTWNLLNDQAAPWSQREAVVSAALVGADPDVVLLQECQHSRTQVEHLATALAQGRPDRLTPRWTVVHYPHPEPNSLKGIKSLAVLTWLPVLQVEHHPIEVADDIALLVRAQVDERTLTVVTTHLHYGPSAEGGRIRAAQAAALVEWLTPEPGPIVVGGDLNARPGGTTITVFKQRFRSAFEEIHGGEPESTYPTALLAWMRPDLTATQLRAARATIDYLLVAGPVAVVGAEVIRGEQSGDTPGSDHDAVVAQLSLSPT